MLGHLGVAFASLAEGPVIRPSEGTQINALRKVHSSRRDNRSLAHVWREYLNAHSAVMMGTIAGQEVKRVYGQW